jgi:hypothetical protein
LLANGGDIWLDFTDIDGDDVRHSGERSQASADFRGEIGIWDLIWLDLKS